MIHKMNLQNGPFNKIMEGSKTIEMRLNDEKRQLLSVGDFIEFNNSDTDILLMGEVIGLHKFRNFEEMYDAFDKISVGYEEWEDAIPSDMSQYYSEDDILKYGVLGIELKLVKEV